MTPLLCIKNLKVTFLTSKGPLCAVRGIDFSVFKGEIVGIVGESGCGKSAAVKALTRLVPAEIHGQILYEGTDLLTYSERKMRSIRGKEISMIFQDPMTSLNPTMTIGKQIMEGYLEHFPLASRKEAKGKALAMLKKVGVEGRFDDYPHTLSGGMRQRVMIALALACEPKLLLADEPTTALDVTIQAQILALLKEIQKEMHTTIILISHDLSVVAHFCDRILVMYGGKIIESAPVTTLFSSPQHPYTKQLIAAIPRLDQKKDEPLRTILGTPPNLLNPIHGCSFCPRCPSAMQVCALREPPSNQVGQEHLSACFLQGGVE